MTIALFSLNIVYIFLFLIIIILRGYLSYKSYDVFPIDYNIILLILNSILVKISFILGRINYIYKVLFIIGQRIVSGFV